MTMTESKRLGVIAVGVLCGLVVVALAATPVVASHDSPGEWVVQPAETPDDRQPGDETASYKHWAQGGDDFRGQGLEVLDQIEMVSEDLDFSDCDLEDAAAFGIDRGGDNQGTETDDSLAPHVQDFEFASDRMWMNIYDDDDFLGDPTHLDAEDQFIAHQLDCYTNPDEAGWYRMEGWANGTAYDGEFDEARLYSHYFWIGDFENEADAREALGPPPSEQDGTEETPTPTAGSDDDADGESEAVDNPETDDESAPAQGDAVATTPTPASPSDGDTDPDSSDGATTPDAGSGDGSGDTDGDGFVSTPADGPGFGPIVALIALLSAAGGCRRWYNSRM